MSPAMQYHAQRVTPTTTTEQQLDDSLRESFPASDPPAHCSQGAAYAPRRAASRAPAPLITHSDWCEEPLAADVRPVETMQRWLLVT